LTLLGCSQAPPVERPPEGSARLTVLSVEPAPGSVVNRNSVLRVRLEYALPDGYPGEYLIVPQFTLKTAGLTTSGKGDRKGFPALTDAQGTLELVHPLKPVLNDEEVARPLRVWVYLLLRTSRRQSLVVSRAGPFQFYAY
jgi:hypothetical protein